MSFTRTRALIVLAVLAALAIAGVAVALVRDTQGDAAAQGCPAGATTVNVKLPEHSDQVKLRILNGTRTTGRAEQVSEEFKNRGFQMQRPADSRSKVAKVAVIKFGPKTVGAAQWIRAYFLGEGVAQYEATRTTDVIDIVVGDQYKQLATTTEVNQSLAQLSDPKLPPGTCAA
ncbi:LytR C-terminal domain-containing protein [Actinoplanes sp. NPDC049265]|uniref:LytR C-terminal domain-containing protein n=1 Tax=Actinoplanes sp. NPDC049265 TaxID=3363902 RepID=UPI003721ED07